MLARMFSGAEATAIWAQLVDCRLKEIQEASEASQLQGIAALYAAEQGRQILRDDLASWDASARAWLQTANEAKKREDTQLKLIVRNLLSIHNSGTTYSNVIENWIVAMKTCQNLIRGVPQDVTNGAVLLGLMSWHIYPDLNIFYPDRYVAFNDRLVKAGGVITLGLESQDRSLSGVSWSVSLSHLRFYGDPVVIEKSSEDSDRITLEELRTSHLDAYSGAGLGQRQSKLRKPQNAWRRSETLLNAIEAQPSRKFMVPLLDGSLSSLTQPSVSYLLLTKRERRRFISSSLGDVEVEISWMMNFEMLFLYLGSLIHIFCLDFLPTLALNGMIGKDLLSRSAASLRILSYIPTIA